MSIINADIESDLENRREGVNLNSNAQLAKNKILRVRTNSKDLLIFQGKIVQDDFFDENLVDMDQSGRLETAPNNFMENRTLGQSSTSENLFFDLSDFNPVSFIEDNGISIYPSILSAVGFADPVFSDGSISIFEDRRELALLIHVLPFAKRGLKGFISNFSIDTDFRQYPISQEKLLSNDDNHFKVSNYIEAQYDELNPSSQTFADMPEKPSSPFNDSDDYQDWSSKIGNSITENIYESNITTTPREFISSAAGWTFVDIYNGTDSLVYSDRI